MVANPTISTSQINRLLHHAIRSATSTLHGCEQETLQSSIDLQRYVHPTSSNLQSTRNPKSSNDFDLKFASKLHKSYIFSAFLTHESFFTYTIQVQLLTDQEWLEEDYPPCANGPGYILSSDVADFIATKFKKHRLKLFKMEPRTI